MSVYLDNAATSHPKPEVVYTAVERFMREVGASAGRGAYLRSRQAGDIVAGARQLIAELFNAQEPERIVFTANITAQTAGAYPLDIQACNITCLHLPVIRAFLDRQEQAASISAPKLT